jgi:phosphopantetheinyl transferase
MEKKKEEAERRKMKELAARFQAEAEKRELALMRMKQDRKIFQSELIEK